MLYGYSDLPNTNVMASDITEPYKSLPGCPLSCHGKLGFLMDRAIHRSIQVYIDKGAKTMFSKHVNKVYMESNSLFSFLRTQVDGGSVARVPVF